MIDGGKQTETKAGIYLTSSQKCSGEVESTAVMHVAGPECLIWNQEFIGY